jgi:hypothetical protein
VLYTGIGLVIVLCSIAMALNPNSLAPKYTWQRKCDASCATTLGRSQMQKYNDETCVLLRADEMLYSAFRPDQITNYQERMAAIQDRIDYSNCP